MNTIIYFDNSATTRPYNEVIEKMDYVSLNDYGNASSPHIMGMIAEKHINDSRLKIAKALNVDKTEIFFTSGGTESNNLGVLGYLKANSKAKKHVITSKVEHLSILEVFKQLETSGYKVDYINVDKNGVISLKELESLINNDTALVTIMHVNNEVGTIQPIKEISEIIKSKNESTIFHVDAVQSFGKMKIKPEQNGIDLLSISAHKIHGPKGIGALYKNKNIRINPVIFGGGQESKIRSGTENVPGIYGFGLACEIIHKKMDENRKKILELKSHFIKLLKSLEIEHKVLLTEKSVPNIFGVSFPETKSEVMLRCLQEKNIFASAGSACSSRKSLKSHVLKAMKIDKKTIDGTIRFSFSEFNSVDEIDYTVKVLKTITDRFKSLK